MTARLWRARRRHDQLEAVLARRGEAWELRFVLNRRALLSRLYGAADEARAEAEARLRELQRAGWNVHW